ncbi:phage antirepressor N-terminal domain-containing protein [Streptomyces sp. H27-H5]|uniref:phage antirepressor N-terminal domain-containing protein n=1 Tax=Streptomyces sp. H27-H5 TaxID=2996460 RepID=UPI00226F45F9|nr:phage antirepressor N-terminal domain-containing protein [Streptomyces sp. H27-H5]MCY0962456.1 phage antirepressor KilAC domain-containing protein [Streptomyces sp. H27-H5]
MPVAGTEGLPKYRPSPALICKEKRNPMTASSPESREVVQLDLSAGSIHTTLIDGQPHIVLKPAVESLGLDFSTQLAKLRGRSWATVGQSPMVAEDGKTRVMTVIPVRTFLMLLATVNENRVNEVARPTLVAFQNETADAVETYWTQSGARTPTTPALPQDYEEALVALIGQVREAKVLSARVAELEPAAQSWNTLAEAVGDFAVADAAKILSRDPAMKLGRNRLFTLLDDLRWTYRQQVDGRPRAMQAAIETGRLSELPSSHYHPRTGELVLDAPQVRVTVKGLHELHKRLGGLVPVQVPSVPQQRGGAA